MASGARIPGQFQPRSLVKADLRTVPVQGSPDANYLQTLSNNELLRQMTDNSNVDLYLKTLANPFYPRVVDVRTSPTLLIEPAQIPRGYTVINPQLLASGQTGAVTLFASSGRAPGVYTSPEVDVSAIDTVRGFLDITAQDPGATIQVDFQSQDPLSLNWVTVSTNIFTGASSIGSYYADVGPFGVDANFRAIVTVAGGNITFSLSMLTKGGIVSSTGSIVALGPSDVNIQFGYTLLPGQKETFYLRENTPLYAITASGVVAVRVFQLQ